MYVTGLSASSFSLTCKARYNELRNVAIWFLCVVESER
jgi:hypothetical protein